MSNFFSSLLAGPPYYEPLADDGGRSNDGRRNDVISKGGDGSNGGDGGGEGAAAAGGGGRPSRPKNVGGDDGRRFGDDDFNNDDDEEGDDGGDGSPPTNPTERHALEYLLRYEIMVRTQDAELMATSSHLRPLFDAMRTVGERRRRKRRGDAVKAESDVPPASPLKRTGSSIFRRRRQEQQQQSAAAASADGEANDSDNGGGDDAAAAATPEGVLTYRDMRRAVRVAKDDDDDDDNDTDADEQLLKTDLELLRTDLQLMYVLKTLADNDATLNVNDDDVDVSNGGGAGMSNDHLDGLTFPEFVHCYRTTVCGMQCLQQMARFGQEQQQSLPSDDDNGDDNDAVASDQGRFGGVRPWGIHVDGAELRRRRQRRRVVDRTASLVRMFGVQSSSQQSGSVAVAGSAAVPFDELKADSADSAESAVGSTGKGTAGGGVAAGVTAAIISARTTSEDIRTTMDGPDGHRIRGDYSSARPRPSGEANDDNATQTSGVTVTTQPTKAEVEMRRLLAVKDRQLVRILSEHARHVESTAVLTRQQQEARWGAMQDEERAERRRRRAKKRRRMLAVAMAVGLALLSTLAVAFAAVYYPDLHGSLLGFNFVFTRRAGGEDDVQVAGGSPSESPFLGRFDFSEMAAWSELYEARQSAPAPAAVPWVSPGERDELDALRRGAIQSNARIFMLEMEGRSLRADLDGARSKLGATERALRDAREGLARQKRAAATSRAALDKSVSLESCRAQVKEAREDKKTEQTQQQQRRRREQPLASPRNSGQRDAEVRGKDGGLGRVFRPFRS